MVSNPTFIQQSPVQNNGESDNERVRISDRTMSKSDQDDDHREFCAFSNYGLQQNLKTTNDGLEDNPHDKHRHRKRENRRKKVVRGSANILGSRFTGGVKVNPLCDIFVHHVANLSALGDLKNHLIQQGFDVDGMRIDVTSNREAKYKSSRILEKRC